MPARRFLGEDPEFSWNSVIVKRKLMHSYKYHITNRTRSKKIISNSPNLDSLLNSSWYAYPFTKTSLALAFHPTFAISASLPYSISPNPLEKPSLMITTTLNAISPSFNLLSHYHSHLIVPLVTYTNFK